MNDKTNPATTLADKWTEELLNQPISIAIPVHQKPDKVEDVSAHDFSNYLFVLDPWGKREIYNGKNEGISSAPNGNIDADVPEEPNESGVLNWLDDTTWFFIQSALLIAQNEMSDPSNFDLNSANLLVERFVVQSQTELMRYYGMESQIRNRRNWLLVTFIEKGLAALMDNRFEKMDAKQKELFLPYFDDAVRHWVYRSMLLDQPWRAVELFPGGDTFAIDETRGWLGNSQQAWLEIGYNIADGFQCSPSLHKKSNVLSPVSYSDWDILLSNELAHIMAWDSTIDCPFPSSDSIWPLLAGRNNRISFTRIPSFKPGMPPIRTLLEIADSIIAAGPSQELIEVERVFTRLHQITSTLGSSLNSSDGNTSAISDDSVHTYGFRPYPAGSINLGLEIVYRQEWKSEGYAKGELVKTLPLGPGQTEKISIRRQERDHVTRQMTDVTFSEETRESTNKSTNSSEVVEEAAQSRKFEIKADGSFNICGLFGGSVQGPSYGGTSASSSRETKKMLAEAMSRSTAKLRRERKVSVSTEHETSYDETRTSEIKNPNDEIPVTYYYYTLQRRYILNTYLASLQPVLFVAEALPRKIDIKWIRRNAWILNRVVLDESYAPILAQLCTVDHEAIAREVTIVEDQLKISITALTKAQMSLDKLNELHGDVASTYDGTLKAYHEAVQSAQTLIREYEGILAQARRLADHIADNILYYCRAIWGAEDPERRRMRYQNIRIPTNFSLEVTAAEEEPRGSGNWVYEGHFHPVYHSEQYMALSELIDPTGPIAYAGNYAAFRILKNEFTQGISRIIRQTSLAYCAEQTFSITGFDKVSINVINRDLYAGESFEVNFIFADRQGFRIKQIYNGRIEKESDNAAALLETIMESPGIVGGPKLIIRLPYNGVELCFAELPRADAKICFIPEPLVLRDPELTYLLQQNPDLTEAQLAQLMIQSDESIDLRPNSVGTYDLIHSRPVLVDTDNLYLEIDPVPLLETFKQYHRLLDVALVATDVGRRSRRLEEKMYANPDPEKVVVVGDPKYTGEIVAAEAANINSPQNNT